MWVPSKYWIVARNWLTCRLVGYTVICVMNTTQTLTVDLVPDQGSSVSACVCLLSSVIRMSYSLVAQNNLMRCGLGAIAVSVINLMFDAMGIGWTFVLLAGLCVLTSPLLFVIMFIGPKLRAKRKAPQAER